MAAAPSNALLSLPAFPDAIALGPGGDAAPPDAANLDLAQLRRAFCQLQESVQTINIEVVKLRMQLARFQEAESAVAVEAVPAAVVAPVAAAAARRKRGRPRKGASVTETPATGEAVIDAPTVVVSSLEAHPLVTTSSKVTQIIQFILPKAAASTSALPAAPQPIPMDNDSPMPAVQAVVDRVQAAADLRASDSADSTAPTTSIDVLLQASTIPDPLACPTTLTRSPVKLSPLIAKKMRQRKKRKVEESAPREQFSVSQKYDAIVAIEGGARHADVATQHNVSTKTLQNWLKKKRREITKVAYHAMTDSARKTRTRSSVYASLAPIVRQLFAGFLAVRARTGFLTELSAQESCQQLKKLVLEMLNRLDRSIPFIAKFISDIEAHQFSREFCKKLLYDERISSMKLHGEAGSVDQITLAIGRERLREMLLNFAADDIYNCDETAMYWQTITGKRYVSEDVTRGQKLSKQRLTVLCCSNATGDFQGELFIIHTAQMPRCLKGFVLPVEWNANDSAWMTGQLFQGWIRKFNTLIGRIKPGRKVVLLLDNVSSHLIVLNMPADERCNLIVIFFPANTTSELQPQDAGIIAAWKANYKAEAGLMILQLLTSTTAFAVPSTFVPMPRVAAASTATAKQTARSSRTKVVQRAGVAAKAKQTAKATDAHRFDLNHAVPIMNEQWKQLAKTTVQNCFLHVDILSPSHRAEIAQYNQVNNIDAENVAERVVESPEERVEQEQAEQQGLLQEFASFIDNLVPAADEE